MKKRPANSTVAILFASMKAVSVPVRGGYWEVYSSTAIDNAYTSGYCQTFG
ncbi:hypothetical protein BKA12_001159 [Neomicrococcus lactis]|uniref:Uncharacterized protein n=1 Tax=Neomicrococcus lactis TaxID=732241 RepID=A0A7W8YAQ5_9MICC|nr:hypothetical protein [Neomicrococcus lactis]